MASEPMLAIGLMSGTSMDGIDVALIETDGEGYVRRIASGGTPYERSFRERLAASLTTAKTLGRRDERPDDLAALDDEIANRQAAAVETFLGERNIDPATVRIVGFHGQTVLHRPQSHLTVQLGNGPLVAERLRTEVAYDMRAADMEAGGQGAPLVPAYHAALAAMLPAELRAYPVAFVNIGGISNITYVDGENAPIAFDVGPGNALLDQWVEREANVSFDDGGRIAADGRIIDALAAQYLAAPFFDAPAPKSLDRLDFVVPSREAGSLADVARTLCFVTAQAIVKATDHLPAVPKLWIVAGGGRKHPVIMDELRTAAAPKGANVISAEKAGVDGDAVEAEAWAYLAVRSKRGLPLTWPSTTGCDAPTTGGVLAAPTSGASA